MEYGTKARAISYIQISGKNGVFYGAGTSSNIINSSLKAIVSTANKMLA
jgi:2-isopropylmalate synthase